MVVETQDPIWKEVFNKEELYEIKNFKAPVLPDIDEDVKNYLDSFDQDMFKNLPKTFMIMPFKVNLNLGLARPKDGFKNP